MVMLDTMARCCSYSPDGKIIVVGMELALKVSPDKRKWAHLWFLTQQILSSHEARDSKEPLTDIKFSGDGKTMAISSMDTSTYIYNVEDFTSSRCKGHGGGVLHIDFSADDQWLHTTCGDMEMLFWNAYTGEQHKVSLI